jgi:putative membrane protein
MTRKYYLGLLSVVFLGLWLALAIAPYERSTWLLENVLLIAGGGALWASRRVLPLSTASYSMLFVFFCLHAVGAHFTYSLVPYDAAFRTLSGWSLNEEFGFDRNHYDRLVHLAYGLLLALPVRELLMLHARVRGFWSYFLPLDLVMSSSLLYELIEWLAVIVYGGDLGAAFLGTQGDEWDAHRDMALAGLGALVAVLGILGLNLARGRDVTLEWLQRAGKLSASGSDR